MVFANGPPRPRLRAGLSRPRSGLSAPKGNAAVPRPIGSATPSRITKPLPSLQKLSKPTDLKSTNSSDVATTYFSVLYTKRSKKKHKSWLDGYIIVKNDRAVELQNEDGKRIASERFRPLGGLKEGNTLEVASYELEVQNPIAEDDYVSGRVFVKPTVQAVVAASIRKPSTSKRNSFKPLRPKNANTNSLPNSTGKSTVLPVHDPNAPDACILFKPLNTGVSSKEVHVVLDPFLSKRMRPHQLEGVKFLYRCVEGSFYLTGEGGQGAILADEMGLGKSLQAIALIWTLLKQSPTGTAFVKKAAIICPASLVQNWANEVKKWLGFERLYPVQVTSGSSTFEAKEALAGFINGNVRRLLIISYEMFRSYSEQMRNANIGLMVCDEGHRLKSSQGNKTIQALRKVHCPRRVILTGTPVQNDLEEFFAVCDFVIPGCLSSLASFRNIFANPIISSRDSHASRSAVKLGEARAKELGKITSAFVLRRTSDILEKYLPEKQEVAIFCRLQPWQEEAYKKEASNLYSNISDSGKFAAALSAITYLRKICCHPILVDDQSDSDDSIQKSRQLNHEKNVPATSTKFEASDSSKIQLAISMCEASVAAGDKVVLVSNFTSALDLLQASFSQKKVTFCRLDGSTPVGQRGDLVRRFNQGTLGNVFLLSAKAGGVGLNLIGANRLILFDPDWNPATDLQAMARVWRDGQKKPVFIYRLLSTGTIEEKIYQRQLFKGELQSTLDGENQLDNGHMEHKALGTRRIAGLNEGNFSAEELRNLFQYKSDHEYCDTLEVLERSQEKSKNRDTNSDWDSQRLLKSFLTYKHLFQSEQGCNGQVFCGDDTVLDSALNGCMHTHGLVSYLYNKSRSDDINRQANDSTPTRDSAKRKRAKDLQPVLIDTSEDSSSESDMEIRAILKARQASGGDNVENSHSLSAHKRPDSNPSATTPKPKRMRAAANAEQHVAEKKACNTTWEDALHELDTDTFDEFQDT